MRVGIFLVAILVTGGIVPAYSAQLDVDIPADATKITPSYKFLRIVNMEYPEGGQLKNILDGKNDTISFTADKNTTGVSEIISQINSQLADSLSGAFVSDISVKYLAILDVDQKAAKLEYNIQITPTIQNPIITIDSQRYVDTDWRGIKLSGPILIQTEYGLYNINNPESALKVLAPELLVQLQDTDTKKILNVELLDASGIALPLIKWHFLFDPTGIMEESKKANFKKNSVISHYSMGECTIFIDICNDRKWKTNFILDKQYTISAIESRDDATISVEGYGSIRQIGVSEVLGVQDRAPEPTKPTQGFQVVLIYVMAGMAAVGGIAIFVFSNRKLKNEEGQGQRGIDPSQLRVYPTHAGARGYQTVRGEAQLVSDEDYQKTRSVYDEKPKPKSSTRGSLPKGWDKKLHSSA